MINRREFNITLLLNSLLAIWADKAEAQNYSFSAPGLPPLAYSNVNITGGFLKPTSTAAYLMQGVSGLITPSSQGLVKIMACGTLMATGAGTNTHGLNFQIYYGTGPAPSGNHAVTGVAVGVIQSHRNGMAVTGANFLRSFSMTALVPNLVSGTLYWYDVAAEAITATGDTMFGTINMTARELQ